MLSNISWEQYLMGLLLIAAIYYAFVIVKFFPELFRAVTRRKTPEELYPADVGPTEFYVDREERDVEEEPTIDDFTDPEMLRAEALISEIRDCITGVEDYQGNIETLKISLAGVLRNYQDLRYSYMREAITMLITTEAQKILSVTITEEEAEGLWE